MRGGREDAALYARLVEHLKVHGTILTEYVGNEDLLAAISGTHAISIMTYSCTAYKYTKIKNVALTYGTPNTEIFKTQNFYSRSKIYIVSSRDHYELREPQWLCFRLLFEYQEACHCCLVVACSNRINMISIQCHTVGQW